MRELKEGNTLVALGPLLEIVKKHHTQPICLSDLRQNYIMNCFNLIYMLKVRSSTIGSNEYLKFEEVIRDNGAKQLASLGDSVGACTPTEFGDQKLLPNSSPAYRSGRGIRRFC